MQGRDKRRGSRRGGDQARDRFLASLSHELRTPLGGVLGMANLLVQTPLNADQRAYVDAIRDCGQHLLGLVNDVLDLTKLESGRIETHPAPVDLEKLLQGVVELLSPRAHDKDIEIAWCVRGVPPVVEADEGRLRQILYNLAGNAVKFTQRGGVMVTAEATSAGEDRIRLRLSVTDTGPGVDAADAQRIFEPFVQAHSGTGPADSTGLGLAIVDRLATALGGEVGLQSAERVGSTFWFEADFPLLEPAPAARPLEGVDVAIVTPSAVVRAAARLQVEACGGRALGYGSLKAAARAPEGAVFLVDEALRTGRKRLSPLAGRPCIILLTPEQRGRIETSRRAGFAGYLIKPLRRASLAARVLAALGPVQASAPAHDERVETGGGVRVLLAEDNPINAMLARALIEREGCESHRAKTGPEAVEAALSAPFDLILMDLRLPGLDGVGVTMKLRAAGVRTPIVALTADGFEEDRRACLVAGMDDFLVKPLDPAALRQLLARVKSGAFTAPAAQAKLAS